MNILLQILTMHIPIYFKLFKNYNKIISLMIYMAEDFFLFLIHSFKLLFKFSI